MQQAMKSWQLIAVVGDALQVRRAREARRHSGRGSQGLNGREERQRWHQHPSIPSPLDGCSGGGRTGTGAGGRGRSVRIDIRGRLWQASRRQPLSNVSAEKVAGGRVRLWGRGSESGPGGGWSPGSSERQWKDADVCAASELHGVGKFSSGVLWDTIWIRPGLPEGPLNT